VLVLGSANFFVLPGNQAALPCASTREGASATTRLDGSDAVQIGSASSEHLGEVGMRDRGETDLPCNAKL